MPMKKTTARRSPSPAPEGAAHALLNLRPPNIASMKSSTIELILRLIPELQSRQGVLDRLPMPRTARPAYFLQQGAAFVNLEDLARLALFIEENVRLLRERAAGRPFDFDHLYNKLRRTIQTAVSAENASKKTPLEHRRAISYIKGLLR